MYKSFHAFLSILLILLSGTTFVSNLRAGETERVSIASDGTQGNSWSYDFAISPDGRFVVFESNADNLVPEDTNAKLDIFVHDRQTGETTRVSVASDGTQGNSWSFYPAISADGRYVAFYSFADNLVVGDTNLKEDIFIHDRQTGETSLVSVASDGTQGNHASFDSAISADGRFVAFNSIADNLVSGDTNSEADIFVHDRQTGETSLVSVASDGTQGNHASYDSAISADGHFIAFNSSSDNLVPGDINAEYDVFVHDRQTGETTLVSVASDGSYGNMESRSPALSADGRFVTFYSYSDNLVVGDTNSNEDIFVHDRQTGETTRVSIASDGTQGNSSSYCPAISADGNYVAFYSYADNLVVGDTNSNEDIFVHDRKTGETTLVSVASDGTQGNRGSHHPAISADGHYVAFYSYANNLVLGDTNSEIDIFVHYYQEPLYFPLFFNSD